MRPLSSLLSRFVKKGSLTVYDADGAAHQFGNGADGPSVTMRLHDRKLYRDLFFSPELRTPEAYMDGLLTFENSSEVYDLLYLFSVNRRSLGSHPVQQAVGRISRAVKRFQQQNRLGRAAQNVQHHYDISNDLYRLFLDEGMNYSCAYFTDPEQSLESAQLAKFRHAASKLGLKPGMTVCDIGSGWGSFAIFLAKTFDVKVTGVNVSKEQLALSRERVQSEGLGDRVEFIECDYRDIEGPFDRVTSVGMMEHVGVPFFDAYFGKVRDILKPGGYAFIHAIGSMSPPSTTSPFIRKYIFPGGYTPAMSEVFASTERCRLWVADVEILRLHYAYTIRHWRERFAANRDKAAALFDERFCRMWEFYLAAVEMSFRHGSNMVFQLLLSNAREDVPITRDYMFDAERALNAERKQASAA